MHHKSFWYTLTAGLMVLFVAGSLSAAMPKLYETLGSQNVELIKNAKYVTILALVPESARNQYASIKEVHLNQEEIDRLKTNLLDDHNYDFSRVKKCKFQAEVSFKFQDDNDNTLHLFVSPVCNQMLFSAQSRSTLLNYDPVAVRLEPFFQELVKVTRSRNKPVAHWGY